MCLYTKWKFPRIAWKPIKVKKLLEKKEDGLHSPYYDTGVVKKLMIPHKFQWKPFKQAVNIFGDKFNVVEYAIHSYSNDVCYNSFYDYHESVYVDAIIPRFSLYYKGYRAWTKDVEYASSRLKLNI